MLRCALLFRFCSFQSRPRPIEYSRNETRIARIVTSRQNAPFQFVAYAVIISDMEYVKTQLFAASFF